MSDFRYSQRYGFPPLKRKYRERKEVDGTYYVNNRKIKKVKMTIPSLNIEQVYLSAMHCADMLNVSEGIIRNYIRLGSAAKGIIKFEYV